MKRNIVLMCLIILVGYSTKSAGIAIKNKPSSSSLAFPKVQGIMSFFGNGWYTATIDDISLTYWDNDSFLSMSWNEPWEQIFLNDEPFWSSPQYGSGGGSLTRGPLKLQNNTNYTFKFRRPGVSDKTVNFFVTYWEPEVPPTN